MRLRSACIVLIARFTTRFYHSLFWIILLLAVSATPGQAGLPSNTPLVNVAHVFYNDGGFVRTASASATVMLVFRTPSVIEFLSYAPGLSGTDQINVSIPAYRTGSAVTDPFVTMPPPVPVGSSIPIDTSRPVPLTAALRFHQGDPLFIRLTDKDQNLDAGLAETVIVAIRNPACDDNEIVRLTETSTDSGVFVGYLSSTSNPVAPYNGSISASTVNIITVRYSDVQDASDTSAATILVDPFGLIFDSSSGLPISSATISIISSDTGLPAAVFGDDGVSSFPATVTSGGTATDSSGRVYAFQPGGYRFPYLLPGRYQFQVTPPPGYSSPSTVATATIQALPGGPFAITGGSRGETFSVNPGPGVHIDIPLDPSASLLWLQKSSNKVSAGHGDMVPFLLTLTIGSTSGQVVAAHIADTLPIGFRLRAGSVRINTLPAADPKISADGRTLTFSLGTLAFGSVTTIEYVTEVTAGTQLGPAVNSAVAASSGAGRSNRAQAVVMIKDDFLRIRSTLMGRVSTGACNDTTGAGANGVAGVRIYLEDGSFVISDTRGLFHFEGVRAGLHVVQLDQDSIPTGYEAYACDSNSRFAGRTFSQFVETQGGTLWRTDFHLRSTTAATVPLLQEKPIVSASSTLDIEGILSPHHKEVLLNRTNSIRISLDSHLTPRLLVDNREVPPARIGFSAKDEKKGTTSYSYIGVDLGERGEHTVTLQGIDPFGNMRFTQSITAQRSGDIASIRVKSADGNVADGSTPVRLQLELFDADGTQIPAGAELEIRDGTLTPLKRPDLFSILPSIGRFAQVPLSEAGDVLFQPVSSSGLYRVVLAYNGIIVEAETYVQPKLRDWILVGLAEGTLGYNTASGNMESLQGTDMSESLYQDGRIALFAKGRLQGKWLLTMAYDTAGKKADPSDGLFQTINPETYYTLYGDTGQQQYDAASRKKLYLKIEREQFYAMFGDFDSGLTITEFTRYSRRMTGLKSELQGKNYELTAFASESEQAYQRDELPGDGTSGIYWLSRRAIIANSEKISIDVRDRFHSEILISSRTLSRFSDYSIDYDSGTVIFREPVYSRDLQFNPTTVVAEYETMVQGGQHYTYGGRAGIKLLDQRLKAGGTYIYEDQGSRRGTLYGMDAAIKLSQSTKLRVELAASDGAAGSAHRSGTAYLAEVTHSSRQFDAKAYIREQGAGFGLGQQPGSETGTRKLGIEGTYRFNDFVSTAGHLYRQYNLLNYATRDVAEGRLVYTDKSYGASIGILQADDHLMNGSNGSSTQLTVGGKVLTLYDRVTLTVNHAQSLGNNSNSDFPTRSTLGAEFRVTNSLSLLAVQELTWGAAAVTQNTRLGMRSAPWKGAALISSVERQFNEYDERVFANAGLRQTWQISDALKIDAGLERSQTLASSTHYQFSAHAPPASGSTENFTAASGGATYQVKQTTWDNRLEFRLAGSEEKWSLFSGLIREIDSAWAWSGRAQIFLSDRANGSETTTANMRFGLVFRPPETRLILLNRMDYMYDKLHGGTGSGIDSWRVINNLITNYRPHRKLQISLQYGIKYVHETISNTSFSSFSEHIGFESRYDMTAKWDIGMRGSLLHSWQSGQYDYSCGPSAGYNIFDNAWISVGYNLLGFEDNDFSSATYTVQGPYVRFRMKFDQQSLKESAAWLNR